MARGCTADALNHWRALRWCGTVFTRLSGGRRGRRGSICEKQDVLVGSRGQEAALRGKGPEKWMRMISPQR